MNKNLSFERLILLNVPWILATLLKSDPLVSYYIAWLGSFFIFFATLTGWVKALPTDMPIASQLMRPIFSVQIIFAGYTCCTSIFYFLNELGYNNLSTVKSIFGLDSEKLYIIAQCQRYYCLGHAAFVSGMLCFMNYPIKLKYRVETRSQSDLIFHFAIICLPLSILFTKIPGLSQFSNQLISLSFIAGTLALAFAIPQKKLWYTIVSLGLYFSNFYTALTSGFKEPIIISILVLAIFLYPTYKKIVLAVFIPVIFLLFFLLPTYATTFRANAWSGDASADEASELALHAVLNSGDEIDETNWGFLVYRLSEIDMFTTFVQSTPQQIPFYKTMLMSQSLTALIPRIFWPKKPNTEAVIMERVYDAGVVNRASSVSAKPAFIVDAYLSYGGFGVWLFLFIYGAVAQSISIKAERLFGGYLLGTALIFAGLFQVFWRGLSLEFIINTVFWSYITMLIVAWLLRYKNILKPA
ncbi:exosortase Y-associated Wzy-like protein [Mucilaginibacter glaciei]|uniref:Oligosaccharide repeat unit polymerase n=1 Tax=Mucilaginibacter glaciei TaxID=2772109 RepID=A0A926NZC9_9SPHI|nr:hypothetical protein [Mucilaginibacter glaciei]MBD1394723.1 hypothetical protein [Mucilaginibacter glaciei]